MTRSHGGGEFQRQMNRYTGINPYYMSEQGQAPIVDDLSDIWKTSCVGDVRVPDAKVSLDAS